VPLLLGKLPHQPGAISWRYSDIFDKTKLTRPPLVFGHVWNETEISMLGNDKCGNCVWATQAHLLQTMQRGIGREPSRFTDESVIADYSEATGYNPQKPATDKGTYMHVGATFFRQKGILDGDGVRHKIEAYVDVKINDPDELFQACFDFGGVALGLKIPQNAIWQFEHQRPWTVPIVKKVAGGHAVALVGRNRRGDAIIATWNGITAASRDFLHEFVDECVAFISLEYLDARGINPRGYDRAALEQRLAAL
jgi:hypothetical protein